MFTINDRAELEAYMDIVRMYYGTSITDMPAAQERRMLGYLIHNSMPPRYGTPPESETMWRLMNELQKAYVASLPPPANATN